MKKLTLKIIGLILTSTILLSCGNKNSNDSTNDTNNKVEKEHLESNSSESDATSSQNEEKCSNCDGTGMITCKMCGGTGVLKNMPGVDCGCLAYNKNMIQMGKETDPYQGPVHPCRDCKGTGQK